MSPDGSKAKVLGRLGTLIFRSDWYQYEIAHYRPFTVKEAEDLGWKLLVDGIEPMSKKEAERLLGNVKLVD